VVILLAYLALGAVMGVAAAVFVRGLHALEDLFDEIPGNYFRHILGMLLVGALIYALMRWGGHYYVEGVGYATIQATLTNQLGGAWFLLLLYVCKLLATSLSLGSGSSGGIFSPSLFMGATLGGAFGGLVQTLLPGIPVSIPAFAMVGMGTMVGAGTGAAMTSVAMVFEMTRDYNIVLPTVLAVAIGLGVRRLLSRENIYTMKLYRRGHPIPKALHANMFLVRAAKDVMDTKFLMVDAEQSFADFLHMSEGSAGMRHVVVTRGNLISGVLRVNTSLRQTVSAAAANVKMGGLAQRNYTVVRKDAAVFDVIRRMWRRGSAMGVVVDTQKLPRKDNVVGVITKELIADEVAASVRMYPR
jgi:chloride channel protein, CIC family